MTTRNISYVDCALIGSTPHLTPFKPAGEKEGEGKGGLNTEATVSIHKA
jgi:hypothetical protein